MSVTASIQKPTGWKNYEDFSAGIAANRLSASDALAGKHVQIALRDGRMLDFTCQEKHALIWTGAGAVSSEWYEAILVAPDTYFIDTTFSARPKEALTLIVNFKSGRVLSIRSIVREEGTYGGEPRVAQEFLPGVLAQGAAPGSFEPAPTRDLIGLREFSTYSPNHTYEHIYLSSERYCWQCLVGEQRGHGDVDLSTTYKFADNQYLFTFREFIIPVSSVFFFNFADLRSTGKFLGVTAAGNVENQPAGAFIEKASMTFYPRDAEPV